MSVVQQVMERASSEVVPSRLRMVTSLMTHNAVRDHRASEEEAVVMTAWMAWVRKVLRLNHERNPRSRAVHTVDRPV